METVQIIENFHLILQNELVRFNYLLFVLLITFSVCFYGTSKITWGLSILGGQLTGCLNEREFDATFRAERNC